MLLRKLVPLLLGIDMILTILSIAIHAPKPVLPATYYVGSSPPVIEIPERPTGVPDSQAPIPRSGTAVPSGHTSGTIAAAGDPDDITFVVNKHQKLPEGYEPEGLIYPDIPFIFKERLEKRMLRRPAAQALEKLAAAAQAEGLTIKGVSGYRSHKRQKEIFEAYVKRDGLAKASTYSAYPGTSEHETGLAIDITGGDGSCASQDCFVRKPEAGWVAKHAHEYGYIIRYPEGKEDITGYKYEPWHLRYVGKDTATILYENDLTLEEFAHRTGTE